MPQQDVPRETFIALRARREAYQVATDILYEEPIDVRTIHCEYCDGWIDVHSSTVTDPIRCPSCGERTPLPPYLRAKYLSRTLHEGWEPAHEPPQRATRVAWYTVNFPWWVWVYVFVMFALVVLGAMFADALARAST